MVSQRVSLAEPIRKYKLTTTHLSDKAREEVQLRLFHLSGVEVSETSHTFNR